MLNMHPVVIALNQSGWFSYSDRNDMDNQVQAVVIESEF